MVLSVVGYQQYARYWQDQVVEEIWKWFCKPFERVRLDGKLLDIQRDDAFVNVVELSSFGTT